MAVGRLTGTWILAVLQTSYPDGVLRRVLLDEFAAMLVSPRSSRGAKGRLARRLYARLEMLQRRGRITQAEGIVRLVAAGAPAPRRESPPVLGPILRKRLFLALLAEDGAPGDGPRLRAARWEFLAGAVEAGWTPAQGAEALGISPVQANAILAAAPRPGR
jgi:hypothetical protein